jgi:hypothetical protein
MLDMNHLGRLHGEAGRALVKVAGSQAKGGSRRGDRQNAQ